jgi:hypothetical protein
VGPTQAVPEAGHCCRRGHAWERGHKAITLAPFYTRSYDLRGSALLPGPRERRSGQIAGRRFSRSDESSAGSGFGGDGVGVRDFGFKVEGERLKV